MKKIIKSSILLILLSTFIWISNAGAYELPKEKIDIITKSLDTKTITTIDTLLSKWTVQKTYDVYNKISKVVYNLQMKTISNTKLSESKKIDLINKYNAVLYLIEKHLDDKYKPSNSIGDSI